MRLEQRQQAAREALYAEHILAKSGLSVVTAILDGAAPLTAWQSYPPEPVFDPASGAQYYYHAHDAADGAEHGHFHCFLRPDGKDGPFHHLIALAIDRQGALCRLFTVNRWVTGEAWLPATETAMLLPRFDIQLAKPDYLTNRWLTAILRLYEDEIVDLLRERDEQLARAGGAGTLDDPALEMLSTRPAVLAETKAVLGI